MRIHVSPPLDISNAHRTKFHSPVRRGALHEASCKWDSRKSGRRRCGVSTSGAEGRGNPAVGCAAPARAATQPRSRAASGLRPAGYYGPPARSSLTGRRKCLLRKRGPTPSDRPERAEAIAANEPEGCKPFGWRAERRHGFAGNCGRVPQTKLVAPRGAPSPSPVAGEGTRESSGHAQARETTMRAAPLSLRTGRAKDRTVIALRPIARGLQLRPPCANDPAPSCPHGALPCRFPSAASSPATTNPATPSSPSTRSPQTSSPGGRAPRCP